MRLWRSRDCRQAGGWFGGRPAGGEKSWEIDFIGIYQTGKPEFTLQPSDNKL